MFFRIFYCILLRQVRNHPRKSPSIRACRWHRWPAPARLLCRFPMRTPTTAGCNEKITVLMPLWLIGMWMCFFYASMGYYFTFKRERLIDLADPEWESAREPVKPTNRMRAPCPGVKRPTRTWTASNTMHVVLIGMLFLSQSENWAGTFYRNAATLIWCDDFDTRDRTKLISSMHNYLPLLHRLIDWFSIVWWI